MSAAGPLFRLSLHRLTARPLQTALKVAAVAGGVAFVFAIQVINRGPQASYRDFEGAVAGKADAYLIARSPQGVTTDVFDRVERLSEVIAAAPMTQHLVRIWGPRGSARSGLIGIDRRIGEFNPPSAENGRVDEDDPSALGLHLPPAVAQSLGVGVGDQVTVSYGARSGKTLVAGVLGGRAADALGHASVAIAPIGLTQRLTGTQGRITRVLVRLPKARTEATDTALADAGGGLMDVVGRGHDARLLASVSAIENQLASLFALLTLLIGAMLVYSVTAITALEWRRDTAVLRTIGADRLTLFNHSVLEAGVIGLVGSSIGVALGRVFVTTLAGDGPQYLSSAFLIDAGTSVPVWLVLAAVALGTLVAIAGAATPTALDLRARNVPVNDRNDAGSRAQHVSVRRVVAAASAALIAGGITYSLLSSRQNTVGIAMLVAGAGMLIPSVVRGGIRVAYGALPRPGGPAQLGIAELRALPGRTTALVMICAMCLGGLVLIGGSVRNFQSGMAHLADNVYSVADLWISVAGPENNMGTQKFDAADLGDLSTVPGVRDTRAYPLAFLDFHEHRVIVLGYAQGVKRTVGTREFVRGDRRALINGLPNGRDIAISESLARSAGLRLGQRFLLPTPTGMRRVRYAATIRNYGWQAGAITMNARSFARYWATDEVSMLGVRLSPGANVNTVKSALRRRLGAGSLFRVETRSEGQIRGRQNVDAGTARLRQIVLAVLIGALLAITSGSLAAITQRRRRLASLRAIGMSPVQIGTAILCEIGFVLALGALAGITLGVAGQALLTLTFSSAGYPVGFTATAGPLLWATGAAAVLAIITTGLSAHYALRRTIVEDLTFE